MIWALIYSCYEKSHFVFYFVLGGGLPRGTQLCAQGKGVGICWANLSHANLASSQYMFQYQPWDGYLPICHLGTERIICIFSPSKTHVLNGSLGDEGWFASVNTNCKHLKRGRSSTISIWGGSDDHTAKQGPPAPPGPSPELSFTALWLVAQRLQSKHPPSRALLTCIWDCTEFSKRIQS